jgi:hypothetical protein
MDASSMFPQGFHSVREHCLPDGHTIARHVPRRRAGVKYYFIDYGISSYFPPGSSRERVTGIAGRDQDVPELSESDPYDPFAVDIFTIGHNLSTELCEVSEHVFEAKS